MGAHYPSDLTDGQWKILARLLPARKPVGRPPLCRRAILNAIFYVCRTGCQWRMLPSDFPKWKTVYTNFLRWRKSGVWERMQLALNRLVRKAHGKKPTPSAAIVDSQSIRTAEGGEERGYDAGKKITGRKRHIAVDTLGLVWAVVVHAACFQDQLGAVFVLEKLKPWKRLKVLFADAAYGRDGLPAWVKATYGWILQTVLRPVGCKGFVVLPKRWIVERTFAWIVRYRRNAKDYERNTDSCTAMIRIAMIQLMTKRLDKRLYV